MTYAQVKMAFFDEGAEIALATQPQIDKLCEEIGNDWPQVRYDNAKEELDSLMSEFM